jgi:hypothetical protein
MQDADDMARAAMKTMQSTLLLVSVFAALSAPSFVLADDELCPKAYTWFSCPLDNGKTVAICGSPSTDINQPIFGADNNAWLQYRYGTADNIELRYPDTTGSQLWRQFMGGINFTPGGEPEQITFSFINGGIRYLLEGTQVPYQGPKNYRLTVIEEATGNLMAEHRCLSADYYELQPIVDALPCDPGYPGNSTRGDQCRLNGDAD